MREFEVFTVMKIKIEVFCIVMTRCYTASQPRRPRLEWL